MSETYFILNLQYTQNVYWPDLARILFHNTVSFKDQKLKLRLRLQRSYDDDVKQYGERCSTCHQECQQTGGDDLVKKHLM